MEGLFGRMSQKNTTLFDDPSLRLQNRPSSQSHSRPGSQSQSQRQHLAQAPGQGIGFDDIGSSFGHVSTSQNAKTAKKPGPSRVPSCTVDVTVDSGDDEMDLFSDALSPEPPAGGVHSRKVATEPKGKKAKARAVDADMDSDGVVIDGQHHKYHEDYKPKKLPSFKKKNTVSESQLKPSLKSTSTSTSPRKARPTYLGSSANPISITAEPKPKPKPKSQPKASTSRTSPLHDRSSNRPSNSQNEPPKPRPKARPAHRAAKAAAKADTFPDLPPRDAGFDTPVGVDEREKGKKGKISEFPTDGLSPVAERRVEKSSSFPQLSPLASPSTPTKKAALHNVSPLKRRKGVVDDSDDELGMNSDDELLTRGGPRPFPMSTQMLETISRRSPTPRAAKRLSPSGGKPRASEGKKRKDADSDITMALNCTDTSEDDDSLFLDPSVDPSTLCPYCDEPLPLTPTPHLLALLASTLKKSYPDSRPSNPKGRKAPLATFISVCQRHRFESIKLPEAERKGWPTVIKFEDVRGRVENMKAALEAIVLDGDAGDSDSGEDENDLKAKGPRAKSVFWKEVKKEVKKKGTRAVVGVGGQFASFEKTQPGYYGELGSVIIHQTLYSLFPPSSFDPTLIAPLTPTEFIQRILVPEAAVGLIMEDRHMNPENDRDKEKAVKILRKSAAYGVAMFPDADTNGGRGKKGTDDWDMGVGDEIVRERARARRKELEEEERLEAEAWARNGAEHKADGKKTGKSKRLAKGKRIEKEMEVMELSEATDAGRPRPRPRKVQREASTTRTDDACLPSDTAEQTNRQGRTAKRNVPSSKDHKSAREGSHINLCSSSSDAPSDASWAIGRGVLTRARKRNGQKQAEDSEASTESANLVYLPSDPMPLDGSDPISDAGSTIRQKRADRKVKGKSKASGTDSENMDLLYPSTSPTTNKSVKHISNIPAHVLASDDATPRASKAAPKGVDNSTDAKSSFPLKIARDRQVRKAGESEWEFHMAPSPPPMDVDDLSSDDSCDSIRGYLKPRARQGRQKNEHSWLLSSPSMSSVEYGN